MFNRINFSNYRTRLTILLILMAGIVFSMILVFLQSRTTVAPALETNTQSIIDEYITAVPQLITSEVVTGLSNPWDVVFLPDKTLLYNERDGRITKLVEDKKVEIADINDVYAVGEGGLTGLAVDPEFETNRFLYTCFNARTASGLDVRVVRWRLNEDASELTERRDIITGIPSNVSGRHSGCRVRTDKAGSVWIGTGDAAVASHPQNPRSLGGKILRVSRDGMPVPGNLPAPYDPRIFSFGHRNVQGLVLFNEPIEDVYGYSVEHGSDIDDEVNLLKSGNFGWSPNSPYNERGVSMTDLERFPDAITAVWSSGESTIAPSGAVRIQGERWGAFNGSIAVAVLKDRHVRMFTFNDSYELLAEKQVLGDFGRIRSVIQGPDEKLYITTDNGTNDKIIRVTPV